MQSRVTGLLLGTLAAVPGSGTLFGSRAGKQSNVAGDRPVSLTAVRAGLVDPRARGNGPCR